MLAVSLLSFSEAYTYQTFFKVFTIVIIFALFYGTFLLPVILSIFAPKPYDMQQKSNQRLEETELCVITEIEESEFIKKNDKKINSNCDSKEKEKLNGSKLDKI